MQMRTPEDCNRFSVLLRREASQALDRTWPWLTCPKASQVDGLPLRVLHLGCGSGDVTTGVLAPRLPETVQVVGADPNCAMVQYATLHCQNPGIFYTQADISGPHFDETTLWKLRPFSQIFSFNYVQSLSVSLAMNRVHELLAPGGEAVLTMITFSPLYTAYAFLATNGRYSRYMKDIMEYVSPYQVSDANYLVDVPNLFSMGFELRTWMFDSLAFTTFNSEEEFVDYLVAIDPFVGRMPQLRKLSYIRELLELCKGLCGVTVVEGSSCYRFNFSRLTVVVRKRLLEIP